MRCVAVPVFGGNAPSGGISLSGPCSRFPMPKLRDLRDCAVQAASRLSLKLHGGA
jgi:DNA-binding IclR family transcriptional regulator